MPVVDFFANTLYDRKADHSGYFEKNLRVIRSWKVASPKYRPEGCGDFTFALYRLDYLISKLIYPGLDAMDYLACEFYHFRHAKRKTFVTERYLWKMDRRLNGGDPEGCKILSNKVRFNERFSAFIQRRWLGTQGMSKESFSAFCDGLDEVIVKPLEGIGGHGIYKASVRTETERNALFNRLQEDNSNYIVEEIIRQHPDLAKLNPSSVNSYRIYTCSLGNGEIVTTAAAIRIGSGKGPTDNFHEGGYAATVGCDTGIIISRAINFNGESVYVHPGTKCVILGTCLPEWNKAIETVKAAHGLVPGLGYIAWDVAVCEDASVTLIEANTCGDVGIQQHPSLRGMKPVYDQIMRQRKMHGC